MKHLALSSFHVSSIFSWMTMDCCVNDVIAFLNLHPQNKLLWLRTRAKVVEEKQNTPLLKKLNRARNDLSGKIIPLFKTYQDWEKKIIVEPFEQQNLSGQPTILVT